MIIILLGPPGAGKGIQAKLLSDQYQLTILSIGELLRRAVNKKSATGLKVKETINNGRLVPDNIILDLVESNFSNNIKSQNCILDGFPRTIYQAKKFHLFCKKNNIGSPYIIVLDLQEEEIIKRLSARIFCSHCNQSYNLLTSPMKVYNTCDICNSISFYKREDDKKKSVKKRLIDYYERTKLLITYYYTNINNNNYFYLKADMSIKDINQNIISFLNTRAL